MGLSSAWGYRELENRRRWWLHAFFRFPLICLGVASCILFKDFLDDPAYEAGVALGSISAAAALFLFVPSVHNWFDRNSTSRLIQHVPLLASLTFFGAWVVEIAIVGKTFYDSKKWSGSKSWGPDWGQLIIIYAIIGINGGLWIIDAGFHLRKIHKERDGYGGYAGDSATYVSGGKTMSDGGYM